MTLTLFCLFTVGSLGTVPSPMLREYWTGNKAIPLVDFSYWTSELAQLCNKKILIYILDKWIPCTFETLNIFQRRKQESISSNQCFLKNINNFTLTLHNLQHWLLQHSKINTNYSILAGSWVPRGSQIGSIHFNQSSFGMS